MAYKDRDRQRQANRAASQRRRNRQKGMTQQGMTQQGMTQQGMTQGSTDYEAKAAVLPASVPEPVRSRYAKGEPEYVQTIDQLLTHTIDQLKAQAAWIPVWRYTQG